MINKNVTQRDYAKETKSRVTFIRKVLKQAGAKGVVFGNSGGKDSALCGILCKMACENTVGVIMPCAVSRNFEIDRRDALEVAERYGIESITLDLTPVRAAFLTALDPICQVRDAAAINIAPRLRMTALYAIAQTRQCLVAGTGNRSEAYVGYFTKWGDGAYDFNPISDLTVTEIYEFLDYLDAPQAVRQKAPSAGLYDAQTDEAELGFSYQALDRYLLFGECDASLAQVIEEKHATSAHKRAAALCYLGGQPSETE